MRQYKSQLRSLSGDLIQTTGGNVLVVGAGTQKKVALTDKDGGALSNPVALNKGAFDFHTADTVAAVDLFIFSPTGHCIVKKNVKPSSDASIAFDSAATDTTYVLPFHFSDYTPNSEVTTGIVFAGAAQPGAAIEVVGTDSGITIDIGTLSSASGDADGLLDGVSCANAGYIKGTVLNGSLTLGAYLYVQDSANAGDKAPEQNIVVIGKAISFTLGNGADTATGYFIQPVKVAPSKLV